MIAHIKLANNEFNLVSKSMGPIWKTFYKNSTVDCRCSYVAQNVIDEEDEEENEFTIYYTSKVTQIAACDEMSVYYNIANILLTRAVLHLHSSFVLYKGRALIFTGPSGIGKTTQAELWRDFQGAEIINGDACLLRELEDGWHAFGTPVHGSSPYCENKDAPLAALVALEQGPENRLERLDSFAALTACLPEFYRPQMDPATQDIFWGAVDSLFRKTPVYRLLCRPDRDATELVKRTIFPAG